MDSNHRPPACQAGALTSELRAYISKTLEYIRRTFCSASQIGVASGDAGRLAACAAWTLLDAPSRGWDRWSAPAAPNSTSGLVDGDGRLEPLFVQRIAGRRQVAGRRQPQAGAVRQLDQLLDAARPIVCSPIRSARWLPDQRRREELGGAGRAGVDRARRSAASTRRRRRRRRSCLRAPPLVSRMASVPLPTNSRASARPCRSVPLDVRRTSTTSFVAPPFGQVRDLRLHLIDRRVRRSRRRGRSRRPASAMRAGDVSRRLRLARELDDVRIVGVAADDRERDLRAGRAAQRAACLPTPTCRASACR